MNYYPTSEQIKDLSLKNQETIKSGKLIFSEANGKIRRKDKDIFSFDLPSGYTCPCANECLSYANPKTRKIRDGKNTKFRCFAASTEIQYPRKQTIVWYNFQTIRNALNTGDVNKSINLIMDSLPEKFDIIRIHVHGDFFSDDYFLAWLFVAQNIPDKIFYAYTKRVDLISKYRSIIPKNFNITISVGGKLDNEIEPWMKTAKVFYDEQSAINAGLEIDHDDRHAYESHKSFALIIHGTQPAKSESGKALRELKKSGYYGYGKTMKPFYLIRKKSDLNGLSINQIIINKANKRKSLVEKSIIKRNK